VLGEVVRRTDPQQRPFGRFVQDEICAPLGIDSLFLGVPDGDLGRVAVLESEPSVPLSGELAALRALTVPPHADLVPQIYNRRDVLQACIPATGLTANARSLARLFAMLANRGTLDGVRLLAAERVDSFGEQRPDYDGIDQTNLRFMPVGTRGFWLADPAAGEGVICSVGRGGAVAWADLDTGLSAAICHNRLFGAVPPELHPLAPIGAAVRAVAAGIRA
jgi:CubicO group peptidase (beta-lactamase class C family)